MRKLISLEMTKIMEGFGKLKDIPAEDRRVQTQVKVLQDYISDNFYTCTQDILAGLGEMYVQDDRFKKNIDKAYHKSFGIGSYFGKNGKCFPAYLVFKILVRQFHGFF